MARATKVQAASLEVSADPAPEAAKRTRKTRQPIKALNKSAEVVAANAKADRDRKAASKKALKAATTSEVVKPSKPEPIVKTAEAKAAEHAAYVAALRIDAEALGVDPDTYIAEQLVVPKTGYTGPMLALRKAVKHYVKAANGQPCCGDDLAQVCGAHTREQTVSALLQVFGFAANPYAHLNPGQQSMNLRNKARAALKNGSVTLDQIRQAFAAA